MKKEPTTERLTVGEHQSSEESYLIYLMHVATYKYSLNFISGKRVLDFGCGSGYGTALVSKACSEITGVDVSQDAIEHARSHFNAPNLTYMQVERAEESPLPFPDASFDVVLSFQVIEHVEDVHIYLQEIKRILIPGGIVLVATPDRASRLFSFQKPWNMWHLREYTRNQLYDELAAYFINVAVKQIGGQRDVLIIELSRAKRLRWLLLPITLPFIPEFIRRNGLSIIKLIRYNLFKHSPSPIAPSFDETIFSISDDEDCGIDLLAIAYKRI